MKKVFILICLAAVGLVACSNRTVKDSNTYYDANGKLITHAKDSSVYYDANGNPVTNAKFKGAKYQIIDQEFDNTLAPQSDYETIPAYELQACGDSYLPPVEAAAATTAANAKGKAKAQGAAVSTKSTRAKKVTNTTNIYYVDGPNPNVPVSSTTTTKTVYTNGAVSSSTTSSSNQKTTVNPDGSVTTTTVNY